MTLTVEGLVEVERNLSRLLAKLGDLEPLMDILGMEIEVDIEGNFEGEHSPAGIPWPKSKRAKDTGGKTLTDSRRLRSSMTHNAGPRSVEVGTNVVYARRHNEGFSGTEQVGAQQVGTHTRVMREVFGVTMADPITVTVKAHTRAAHERKGNTPKREFIGISAGGLEGIRDHVSDYLDAQP